MAASATTIGATAQFCCIRNNLTDATIRKSSSINATSKWQSTIRNEEMRLRKVRLVKRSSNSDNIAAEATTSETTPETAASVEVAKETPSLISALNVDKAFRGIAITEVDHYAVLGLPKAIPYDQVEPAYAKKVEELTKQGLQEEELNKNLQLLKESFMILSSPIERRLYDWSLARNENPDGYQWPFEMDITQTPSGEDEPPAQDPEDVGPTRLVGYFFLGWLILSFGLSVYLNL